MFNVVGLRSVVSKTDGTHYTELHLQSSDRFVNGVRCDVVFVRDDMIENIEDLCLNVAVDVFYNRFGRVQSVRVLI